MPKEMLAPNQRVTLHSLKSSPSLNGKHGTIIGALLESGRYPVQCGKERLALWPANLSLLAEPPAATILPELKLEPAMVAARFTWLEEGYYTKTIRQ